MQTSQNTQTKKTKKQCFFCHNNVVDIDYKDVNTLRRYISSFGKIVSRKRSGVCMAHQRKLSSAIKRARILALLPFVQK